MTLNEALQAATRLNLERLDAQWLLLHTLGRPYTDRAWLLAHGDDTLSESMQTQLQTDMLRRASGQPLAYITGHKAFYGLELAIDARVLDPRSDTETLVDWALSLDEPAHAPMRLIDLGTGSGAIALALKSQRPHWQIHALERSADALDLARHNAQRLGLAIQFHESAWFEKIEGRFHAIVSNPPYIAEHDDHLAALQHEPLQALVSGADGLNDIRSLIEQAPKHLEPQGWLLLEHGYNQAPAVRELLQHAGFTALQSRQDLSGIARCSAGQWPR
jgi:release factor glutamine methyltransferase